MYAKEIMVLLSINFYLLDKKGLEFIIFKNSQEYK